MKKMVLVLGMVFVFVGVGFSETGKSDEQNKQKIEKKKPTAEERREAIKRSFEEERLKKYVPYVEKNIKKLEKAFKEKTLGYGFEYTILDLSRAGDPRAVPILTKILLEYDLKDKGTPEKSPSSSVRRAAAHALGVIGDESAIPALREAYEKEKNKKVRNEITYAIFRIKLGLLGYKVWVLPIPEGDKSTVKKFLAELINDDDELVRYSAAWAYLTWFQSGISENEKKEILSVFKSLKANSKDQFLRGKAKKSIKKIYQGNIRSFYPWTENE